MFRQYATTPTNADNLFNQHPYDISELLESTWRQRVSSSTILSPLFANPRQGQNNRLQSNITHYPHMIYAYMVENTRIYEIFKRVVAEYVSGENLEIPNTPASQRWLRTTEELYFREASPFTSYTLTSQLRPDSAAVRRNAYYRMFGLGLNHGTNDGKEYPFTKPKASNLEFIPTLEHLLSETWRGITNATNTSGSRDTDDDALSTLSTRLRDMLTVRRQNGNLSREEFWFTSMMSWFHLTIDYNSPIVLALRADATSPEERLHKIGQRVGVPSHRKTQAFLYLADELAYLLREIELGSYSTITQVPILYSAGNVQAMMIRIITQYSIATGKDMKARNVSVQPPRDNSNNRYK